MKKVLNIALSVSFAAVIMVPVTGIPLHKLASASFLLLCMIHTVLYRKMLGGKRWLLLATILISFASGIAGMIFEEVPVILKVHRGISIVLVFFLAIHIFVFHKRLLRRKKTFG